MLYFLYDLSSQHEWLSPLRLFRYVTFRAGGATFTAFLITVFFTPRIIKILSLFQVTAPGHVSHLEATTNKRHIPTMGGIVILIAVGISILSWAILDNALVCIFLQLMTMLGLVGFLDDYKKVSRQNNVGLSASWKLVFQFLISVISVWCLHTIPETGSNITKLMIPFFKEPVIEHMWLWFAVLFSGFVVVGSSNAVNLSDGMDGLAIGSTITCVVTYAVFAYVCGHKYFAFYLQVPHIPGCSEVVVIAMSIAGAGLGFLWHNCPPASIFMGDTGSLSIGGAIGLIAVLVKQELLLLIVGGVFVLEAGSVILQIAYYKGTRKITGKPKRLFRCAPIHHHLQQKGWRETQVVIRFWILSLLLAAFGLATLKIR